MTKKSFLVVIISAFVMIMSQSVSAVQYNVLDIHYPTIPLSTVQKISQTLDRCRSFLKNTPRDTIWSLTKQERDSLIEHITDAKNTIENIPPQPTSIQLIFQILIALLAFVIFLVLSVGATVSVTFGSLATLAMVAFMSVVIILINNIKINN